MVTNIIVAVVIGGLLGLLPIMWVKANEFKSKIFQKIINKPDSDNLDIDLITRLLITLFLIALYIVPIALILTYLDSIGILP